MVRKANEIYNENEFDIFIVDRSINIEYRNEFQYEIYLLKKEFKEFHIIEYIYGLDCLFSGLLFFKYVTLCPDIILNDTKFISRMYLESFKDDLKIR